MVQPLRTAGELLTFFLDELFLAQRSRDHALFHTLNVVKVYGALGWHLSSEQVPSVARTSAHGGSPRAPHSTLGARLRTFIQTDWFQRTRRTRSSNSLRLRRR
jgi:hypothetical protein